MYQLHYFVGQLFNCYVEALCPAELKSVRCDLFALSVHPCHCVDVIQHLRLVNHVKVAFNRVMFLNLRLKSEQVRTSDLVSVGVSH